MKIYNSKAPSHYNFYWSIQDDDPEMEQMSSRILLYYIQNNGSEGRLEALSEAANFIGFHVEIVENNNELQLKVLDKELVEFDEMRQKIRNIRRGNFESEVGQIYRILMEYRRLPILNRFINWVRGLK